MKRFGYGTSACKQATLSFSVKSNKTGLYSVQVYIGNNSPNIIKTYTINSANTWERKTITLPTYTTSFTHLSDNAKGLMIDWHLADGPDDITSTTGWDTSTTLARAATGQVNLLDATNNYWQMTNVQFEVGDTATSFEHRSFSEELARCQRYCVVYGGDDEVHIGTAHAYNSTNINLSAHLPVAMRNKPSASTVTSGGNWVQAYMGASGNFSNASISVGDSGGTCKDLTAFRLYLSSAHSGLSAGQALWVHTIANAKLILDADL